MFKCVCVCVSVCGILGADFAKGTVSRDLPHQSMLLLNRFYFYSYTSWVFFLCISVFMPKYFKYGPKQYAIKQSLSLSSVIVGVPKLRGEVLKRGTYRETL